jgi:hypothetical protein
MHHISNFVCSVKLNMLIMNVVILLLFFMFLSSLLHELHFTFNGFAYMKRENNVIN